MSQTTTPPAPVSIRTLHEFKVTKIIDHTPQIRELYLQLANLPSFNFKAGQFVMLHVPVAGAKAALRAYSIASTDEDKKEFKLIFKYVDKGLASRYVWDLHEGAMLTMTGPFGKVFFQEPPTEQIVFLNTGSGVSQHFSFLESKIKLYPNLNYKLFFGVRHEHDIYYETELKRLQQQLKNFEFQYVLSRPSEKWTGRKGYVQDCLKDFDYINVPTTFYLCGNGAMIKDVKTQLLEMDGLDKSKIWAEAFD